MPYSTKGLLCLSSRVSGDNKRDTRLVKAKKFVGQSAGPLVPCI